jgi:hypothetical protein
MVSQSKRGDDPENVERRHSTEFLLAFTIGALVGIGLAVTWIPERRRRRAPAGLREGYRRVRRSGAAALDEIRQASRHAAADFREELSAGLEAAREEFGDMARQQLEQARKTLRREHRGLRR